MNHIPTHDAPGQNTTLRPQDAPAWLQPLLERIDAGAVTESLLTEIGQAEEYTREAAVLVLFTGQDKAESILLTHRTPTLRSHAGQIAFPGGMVDATDTNPVDSALREGWEETGLDRTVVTPVALLDAVTANRPIPIHPVIAHVATPAAVEEHSPDETDEVFYAPVEELVDPANRAVALLPGDVVLPTFMVNGYLVWGVTGALLDIVLRHAGLEKPWDNHTVRDLKELLAASRNSEKRQ